MILYSHNKHWTNRITLDYDFYKPRLVYVIFLFLRTLFFYADTRVYKSSSGRGFHIIIMLPFSIPYVLQFLFRFLFFDCKNRMRYSIRDYVNGFGCPDVLFTHKFRQGKICEVERLW